MSTAVVVGTLVVTEPVPARQLAEWVPPGALARHPALAVRFAAKPGVSAIATLLTLPDPVRCAVIVKLLAPPAVSEALSGVQPELHGVTVSESAAAMAGAVIAPTAATTATNPTRERNRSNT